MQEVNAANILAFSHRRWEVRSKTLEDVVRKEGNEGGKGTDKSLNNLVKSVKSVQCVVALLIRSTVCLGGSLTLQSVAVEANVPVGSVVNHLEKSGHNGVKSVSLHLSVDVLQERLCGSQNPAIHNVGVGLLDLRVEDEVGSRVLLV